ncbi:tetratricopeptide repeat protein [Bradymonas sediminis]|uniref:Uncharacterized protein n=1 Tax=Bradymonas sediminis TaxID=1548548 RepID=A0A2Z4FLU4_9DELT|nr:tetratricopeptide repeat protein [Bradymonas sediminis]AWV89977.1 hypothetical protein DN745_11770 [Bradymonas sediminis]TDP76069.1 tetratricopeptide repeat protein [Bradymonas sediminis]
MQRTIADAWDEYERGHDGEAREIFEQLIKDGKDPAAALLGLARIDYREGNLDRAERRVNEGMNVRKTPELRILEAQILGDRGQRSSAESRLKAVIGMQPDNAFARALYGEQIIRQGRWEDGTNQFIAALSNDPSRHGFQHFRKVTTDLVDALIAGRMPEKTAMQFVNRLAYSIAKPDQEMNHFFGEARRAISGRQAIDRKRSTVGAPLNAQGRLSRPDPSPQARAPQPMAPQPHTSASPYQSAQSSAQAQPARQTRPQPPPSRQQSNPNVDANIQNVRALILEEKRLNEDLLSGIPAPEPLEWPSEMGYSTIDTVPPVLLKRDSLLGYSSQIDTRDFRVTTGSLASEIFLERCLRNLLVATQENKAVVLDARPDSVWQMEMNCRDGLLDNVKPPSELYNELEGYENFAAYSLAMFLGHSLAVTHNATWTFGKPASESFLELGETVLKPFELVDRWLKSEDKESVNLDLLSRLAKRATQRSTAMSVRRDYIDPTRGVQNDSLPATLATLWTGYLFSLSDAAISHVSDSLKIDQDTDGAITFSLPSKWAPTFAAGPGGAGIRDGDRVSLAYIRRSGEFVALATRKGFAAYMEATSSELDNDTAIRALKVLDTAHCPQWRLAADPASAKALSVPGAKALTPPQLRSGGGQKRLEVQGLIPQKGPMQFDLIFSPTDLIPWKLELKT